MKKLLALLGLGFLAIIAVYFLSKRSPTLEMEQQNLANIEAPPPDHEALYSVKLSSHQIRGGDDSPLIELEGTLAQAQRSDNEFISQWRDLSQLSLLGSATETNQIRAMLNKPMVTTINGRDVTHYIDNSFPQALVTFQLGFLEKFYLGVKPETSRALKRSEKDEMGTAEVEYVFSKEGQNYRVVKTWIRYNQSYIKVDAEENNLVYAVGPDGRLISLEGTLTFHYSQPSPMQFRNSIKVALKDHRAISGNTHKIDKEGLKKTSIAQAAVEAQIMQEPEQMSFEEALKKIDTVTESSDSQEVYELFSALKTEVILKPELIATLEDKILNEKSGDASARRRLSTMFGALAQSQSTEGANVLADLATKCPDNFCKEQAIIGLNDHQNPNEDNAAKMLQIAKSSGDSEISGSALLAAGSIGRKLGSDLPQLPAELIAELADPARAEMTSTVIAAMGNHGDAEYFPVLSANLEAEDSTLRSAAVYSMRYLPNEEVDGALIDVLLKETDNDVSREVFKALQHRSLSEEQYLTVAEKTVTMEDMSMQHDAARMLLDAYQANAAAATASLQTLKEKTPFPEIRAYIEEGLEGDRSQTDFTQ